MGAEAQGSVRIELGGRVTVPQRARPAFSIGDNHGGISSSSRDGWELEEFGRRLATSGFVVTEAHGRPWAHRVVGCALGHDDARWSELRFAEGSMADYYENGAAGRRWWERDRDGFSTVGVRYYGMRPRSGRYGKRAQFWARHEYLLEHGRHDAACGWCALVARESAQVAS